MNPFGESIPVAGQDINVDTGLGLEYIRIINNSPYLLNVKLGNQGSMRFPENFLEDIPITNAYNGKLVITPIANFTPASISAALSNLISVNGWVFGELKQPQAQPLTTLAAVGGGALSAGGVASSVVNNGNAVLTQVVEATPSGASSSQLLWNNDGSGTFGGGTNTVDNAGAQTHKTPVAAGTQVLFNWDNTANAGGHKLQLLLTAANELILQDFTASAQLFKFLASGVCLIGSGFVTTNSGTGGLVITNGITSLDNGGSVTSGSGGWTNSAQDILKTGNQATALFGMTEENATTGHTTGIACTWTTVLQNAPTGVTLTDIVTGNAGAPTNQNFSKYGFIMVWTATAAGASLRFEQATSVGN